jgi:hypothetical protein
MSSAGAATQNISSEIQPDNAKDPLAQPSTSNLKESDSRQHSDSATVSLDPSSDQTAEDFHVFTWLNLQATSKPQLGNVLLTVNELQLEEDLAEMDNFLSRQRSSNVRAAYLECPDRNRQELFNILAEERREIGVSDGKALKKLKKYEDRADLVNAAEMMFQFFLPSRSNGPTVGKYWGAVFRLIVVYSRFARRFLL